MMKTDFSTSTLYQCFLEEREEILKHKWIESEKAGKDIGFERALLDWMRNHRDGWKNAKKKPHRNKSMRLLKGVD
jgi:hypothetical protein